MNRRLVLASITTGLAGAVAGCGAIENESSDSADHQINWETIDQLDVEVSNTGDKNVEISLLPDSSGEPFQEKMLGPGEALSESLLPFDEEPPAGSMLEIRAKIGQVGQDQSRMIFTNEIVEFGELSCKAIQVNAVVDDEKVTVNTSCK